MPIRLEIRQRFSNVSRENNEFVKALIIGSKDTVLALVQALHKCGFAEIFEWTDFLPAPASERPLVCNASEQMKVLVKYFLHEGP